MSIDYLKNTVRELIREASPSPQRYIAYFFTVLGIWWCGSALNYRLIDEDIKFKGALLTGIIFFFLSGMSILWEYYLYKGKAESNVESNDNITDMLIRAVPIALPMLFNLARKARVPTFSVKNVAVIGVIGALLYYKFRK